MIMWLEKTFAPKVIEKRIFKKACNEIVSRGKFYSFIAKKRKKNKINSV